MLPTLTDFLAFKEILLDYRADEEGWGLDLHNGLVVTSLYKSSSAGFPEQSVVLCPTSRQWDCSGEQQPDILREASANDRRIHRGKTSSVLQLFINVKYWWVTKTTWLFLGPSYPEDPCVSAATSPRGFESQAPLEQAHILHSPGRLPQHTQWRVSHHHHQPSLFQKALHEYCALSFFYALKLRFSVEFLTWEMFMWMFLKPSWDFWNSCYHS